MREEDGFPGRLLSNPRAIILWITTIKERWHFVRLVHRAIVYLHAKLHYAWAMKVTVMFGLPHSSSL